MTRTRAHELALALRHYVSGAEEAARLEGYQIARDAMASGVGLLEVVADHQEALAIVLSGARTPEENELWAKASAEILAESLGPFEMAHRGFQEANETMLRVNRDLERQVTERLEAEEAARLAKGEAERANRAKSEFLSRMSHELRTPLNAILGFGQLLEMDSLEPEQQESVQQILLGGKHLLDLINEVLDIARIESGMMTLSLEPLLLADALGEAIDLVRPLAAGQGIDLKSEDPCPDDLYVRADRQRLKQVFLNLLSNAVKYNRPGGRVTVRRTEIPEYGQRVEVSDQGPGIAPELMNRLFVPFERLEAEASGVEGTGLGLAISKGLMEAMGGTLGATSVPGQGSTFFVDLPLTEALGTLVGHRGAEGSTAGLARGDSHTILYIEDNLANLRLIEGALNRRPGITLLTATQASIGLDLARQQQPDLILLDLHLPDAPGQELLRQLKADPRTRSIPVIVISADATPAQMRNLLAAGAQVYLTKPIDVPRFFQALDEALAKRRFDDAS